MSGTVVDPIVARALARIEQLKRVPPKPMSNEEIARRIQERRGTPTLADKLAEASEAANITGEGGG